MNLQPINHGTGTPATMAAQLSAAGYTHHANGSTWLSASLVEVAKAKLEANRHDLSTLTLEERQALSNP